MLYRCNVVIVDAAASLPASGATALYCLHSGDMTANIVNMVQNANRRRDFQRSPVWITKGQMDYILINMLIPGCMGA